ncbi:hypothetical protein TWF694_010122 [Orbilia ellipsospora]|uniref:Translin n=1 Tax=Orbilia ellipsospora TaxID=2528407 RepID=A0AAV9X9E2_9PEZI
MSPSGTKRPFSSGEGNSRNGPNRSYSSQPRQQQQQPTAPPPTGPFIPMFTAFRNELDEHHDRRERIIKASRDITAASKKIIFTLHRLRPSSLPLSDTLSPHMTNEICDYESKIQHLLFSLLPDLQQLNGSRYWKQISPGLQEYIEAVGFRHYLLTGNVITWEEAAWYTSGLNGDEILKKLKGGSSEVDKDVEMGDAGDTVEDTSADTSEKEKEGEKKKLEGIKLSKEDYVLGLFDMTGEMMRFGVTSIATTPLSQLIPTSSTTTKSGKGSVKSTPQKCLDDLRNVRLAFEGLDLGRSAFGKDAEKKLEVMQQCVQKVEYAFYGIVVRGSERPDGWVAEIESSGNPE